MSEYVDDSKIETVGHRRPNSRHKTLPAETQSIAAPTKVAAALLASPDGSARPSAIKKTFTPNVLVRPDKRQQTAASDVLVRGDKRHQTAASDALRRSDKRQGTMTPDMQRLSQRAASRQDSVTSDALSDVMASDTGDRLPQRPSSQLSSRRPFQRSATRYKTIKPSAEEEKLWDEMAATEIIMPQPDELDCDLRGTQCSLEERDSASSEDEAKNSRDSKVKKSILAEPSLCTCGAVMEGDEVLCSKCRIAADLSIETQSIVSEAEDYLKLDGASPEASDCIELRFDKRGFLGSHTPRCWAITACHHEPLHRSWPLKNDKARGLSRRQKTLNAKMTLRNDRVRRETEVQAAREAFVDAMERSEITDKQYQRHLQLLFEPLKDKSAIPTDEILDETYDNLKSRQLAEAASAKAKRNWTAVKKTGMTMRILKGLHGSHDAADTERTENAQQPVAGASAILTNDQRIELLHMFQRYVMRVSASVAAAGGEIHGLMARPTWFRFLHHCGLLGPEPEEPVSQTSPQATKSACFSTMSSKKSFIVTSSSRHGVALDHARHGGVSFSHASAVFALYAEVSPAGNSPAALTFSSWVNALQHILRGPNFYRTQSEVIANLFGVCMKRCQQVMGVESDVSTVPDKSPRRSVAQRGSRKIRRSQPGSPRSSIASDDRNRFDSEELRAFYMSGGSPAALDIKEPSPAPAVLGFHADKAEEEMCEPEVLLLLHEYDGPLRSLFKHYARHKWERLPTVHTMAHAPSGSHDEGRPTCSLPGLSAFTMVSNDEGGGLSDPSDDEAADTSMPRSPRSNAKKFEPKMSTGTFMVLLHHFGFFPKIVQIHSVQQHLEISLDRRGADRLNYDAFIECLLRISFVYLSHYGNNVQQIATSKAKCIWLITQLRSYYKRSGLGRRNSAVQRGEGGRTGHDWVKKQVDLDKLQMKELVLWPAMDAAIVPPTRKAKMIESARGSILTGMGMASG